MMTKRPLNRRQLLRLGVGALLTHGLWPGALRADGKNGGEDFAFLVVNDTHSLDKRCPAWFETVVRRMKSHKEPVDFCLHLGDVSDQGKAEQIAVARDAFRELGVTVHYVPGNHDHRSPTDRKAYEDAFPGSPNRAFEHRGWQFVGLDSTEGQKSARSAIQPATLKYLDDSLPRLDRTKPTVIFTHFPLGPLHVTRPTNAAEVLERFKEHNLQAAFGGHFHALTRREVGKAFLTTNRCCATSRGNHDGSVEKGYFFCRVRDGKLTYEFVEVKPA